MNIFLSFGRYKRVSKVEKFFEKNWKIFWCFNFSVVWTCVLLYFSLKIVCVECQEWKHDNMWQNVWKYEMQRLTLKKRNLPHDEENEEREIIFKIRKIFQTCYKTTLLTILGCWLTRATFLFLGKKEYLYWILNAIFLVHFFDTWCNVPQYF